MIVTASPFTANECRGVNEMFQLMGDKWTAQVLVSLYLQPQRFNELKRDVVGISQQMLTRTLRTLERDGMIQRSVRHSKPPQVGYALTPLGRSFAEAMRQLADWARIHRAIIQESRLQYDASR